MLKRKLFCLFLLMAASAAAQSPTAFSSLDPADVRQYAKNYGQWAGANLAYPLTGRPFDLAYALTAKAVINMTEINLARKWHILVYGNLGLPNRNSDASVYDGVAKANRGISLGVQGHTKVGTENSLILYTGGSAKLNPVDNDRIYTFRLGGGGELALGGDDLPFTIGVNPCYVMSVNDGKFTSVQNETTDAGFWTTEAYMVIPVKNRIGLLLQGMIFEHIKPEFSAGLIVATGL